MKRLIETKKAPAAVGPYSQGILSGNTLYLSGQIGIDPVTQQLEEGIEAQTRRCFDNIRVLLSEAGYSFSDVVKITLFLANMQNFTIVNQIYATYFSTPYPVRSCVEVSALPKNAAIEIEVTAIK